MKSKPRISSYLLTLLKVTQWCGWWEVLRKSQQRWLMMTTLYLRALKVLEFFLPDPLGRVVAWGGALPVTGGITFLTISPELVLWKTSLARAFRAKDISSAPPS